MNVGNFWAHPLAAGPNAGPLLVSGYQILRPSISRFLGGTRVDTFADLGAGRITPFHKNRVSFVGMFTKLFFWAWRHSTPTVAVDQLLWNHGWDRDIFNIFPWLMLLQGCSSSANWSPRANLLPKRIVWVFGATLFRAVEVEKCCDFGVCSTFSRRGSSTLTEQCRISYEIL